MASPQLEEGYTRISNKLLEAMYRSRFISGNGFRILLWVIRMSYGWHRKETGYYTLAQIGREIYMGRSSVHLALKVLIEQNVLVKIGPKCWRIQKDYEKWMNGETKVQPSGQKSIPVDTENAEFVQPGSKNCPAGLEKKSTPMDSLPSGLKKGKKGKKTDTAPTKTGAVKPYEFKNETQRIICAYKVIIGFKADDRAWDKANFKIYLRAGSKLLGAFQCGRKKGDNEITKSAGSWLAVFAEKMEAAGRDWNLATAAKIAWDEKAKRDAEDKIQTWENQKGKEAGKACTPTQADGSKLKKSPRKNWMSCIK